ncbi:MAG TPA: ABC transporter permease, partial [Chloroflexota bacterium]|nr:ABC transporter permease [Chloroflexota bacterium]
AGRAVPPILLLALLLAVWQEWTVWARVPAFLLPGPVAIWHALVGQRALLLDNTWPTLEEAGLGFLLSLAFGFALAVAIRSSRLLEGALYPLVIASQTVPVIALAPVLLVLLGFTVLPRLVVVCLVCFFPVVVNTVDGFHSVDRDLTNVMRTLGAGRWSMLRLVELPAALPYFFSGAKIAVTFSVVGAVFGEWVSSSAGLGWLMIQEQAQMDIAVLFAAMAVLTVMGIALFLAVWAAEWLCLPWRRAGTAEEM